MKTGFKDPAKPKEISPKNSPVNGKNSPWDFRTPTYDQRSSCFVQAGTDYGVGTKPNIGVEKTTAYGNVPYGKVDTLRVDEIEYK